MADGILALVRVTARCSTATLPTLASRVLPRHSRHSRLASKMNRIVIVMLFCASSEAFVAPHGNRQSSIVTTMMAKGR